MPTTHSPRHLSQDYTKIIFTSTLSSQLYQSIITLNFLLLLYSHLPKVQGNAATTLGAGSKGKEGEQWQDMDGELLGQVHPHLGRGQVLAVDSTQPVDKYFNFLLLSRL